jgi:hypothetical protein
MYVGYLITWLSKLQKETALSITEAEYVELSCMSEMIPISILCRKKVVYLKCVITSLSFTAKFL